MLAADRAAGMAELRKCTLACCAFEAMIKQAYAAMRTKINFRVFQVDGALAARADPLGQARQCGVVTEFFAALHIG